MGAVESPEHERRDIIRYFEMEHGEAKVERVEKVASERIYGRAHDVWDVHSTDGRWWVITNLTNLYKQDEEFASLDYVLSFHVGLMARMAERQSRGSPGGPEEQDRIRASWRRYEQAADALNEADEAEEFQAVGMRCREALLTFVREVKEAVTRPDGDEAPKEGDFVHWAEAIADTVASGKSLSRLRSYLKGTARDTWQLVGWLTHHRSATYLDGVVAVAATSHILDVYSMALVRHERGVPDRCPECGSYRLVSDYRPELSGDSPYVTLCAVCKWEDLRSVPFDQP